MSTDVLDDDLNPIYFLLCLFTLLFSALNLLKALVSSALKSPKLSMLHTQQYLFVRTVSPLSLIHI